jgi:hypothetical protein
LQSFFAEHCDGDWEHEFGVEITTTDNPGWHVKIDLSGTRFHGLEFDTIKDERTKEDFIIVGVKNNVLSGSGGKFNLLDIIDSLRARLENISGPDPI